jgi:hypothetical protein
MQAGAAMMKALLDAMLLCGLLSLAGNTAIAQTQHNACPKTGKSYGIPGAAAALAGCPFSAAIERESTQTLGDGTRIEMKFKAAVYRDSLGRVRYETYAPTSPDNDFPEAPNMIHIFDPVAGFSYILMPQTAVVSRHRLNDPATGPKTETQPKHSSAQVSTSTQMPEPEPIVEQLGSQVLEGLLVTGRRITRTIPAGKEGNDRVLIIVTESWESSVMGITLLQKNSDPRSGEVVRRMMNLKQVEPDAALFQVPADYTITER